MGKGTSVTWQKRKNITQIGNKVVTSRHHISAVILQLQLVLWSVRISDVAAISLMHAKYGKGAMLPRLWLWCVCNVSIIYWSRNYANIPTYNVGTLTSEFLSSLHLQSHSSETRSSFSEEQPYQTKVPTYTLSACATVSARSNLRIFSWIHLDCVVLWSGAMAIVHSWTTKA